MWRPSRLRATRKWNSAYINAAGWRHYTVDGRQRLSQHWIPSIRGSNADPKHDEAHALLAKAGFIHQAYSGVFQLLPLGLRVQDKIESLIDRHMSSLGASKLSLSALSSEGLWRRSGRLQDASELLKVRTRAKDAFLLSPTHEEEITQLVASTITSPKDVPLRLYQITRKYRDELRPRQGLLRTREFVMKDLYTFDIDEETAMKTYEDVKAAYTTLFQSFNLPLLVAEADTGNMGGSRSHEFHFPSRSGEDMVFHCDTCDYIANEELATAFRPAAIQQLAAPLKHWIGIQRDGRTLVMIYYRTPHKSGKDSDINVHTLKRVVPEIDTSVEHPLERWFGNVRSYLSTPRSDEQAEDDEDIPFSILPIYDSHSVADMPSAAPALPFRNTLEAFKYQAETRGHEDFSIETVNPPLNCGTDLVKVRKEDTCPSCQTGKLGATRAIELGHTFHLGTRYSYPLEAAVNPRGGVNEAGAAVAQPVSMGCHGIGISRMIGAMAAMLKDERGLSWPRACAPFEVVVVPGNKASDDDVREVYDALAGSNSTASVPGIDAVIDDRDGTLIQKLKDADLIGFPVIVALGRAWERERKLEVQCRRQGFSKEDVAVGDLSRVATELLTAIERSPLLAGGASGGL